MKKFFKLFIGAMIAATINQLLCNYFSWKTNIVIYMVGCIWGYVACMILREG